VLPTALTTYKLFVLPRGGLRDRICDAREGSRGDAGRIGVISAGCRGNDWPPWDARRAMSKT